MNRAVVVAVAVITILSGCGGEGQSPAPQTSTVTSTPESTVMSSLSPTAVPTPVPDNPFEKEPIIIGIENPTNRSYEAVIREAVNYWEQTGDQYVDWMGDFEVRPNTSSPDLTVEFVDTIGPCGVETGENQVGCAPVLKREDTVDAARMRVRTGYTNASTLMTLKHEFGHVFGLVHGEEPRKVMNATTVLNLTTRLNASERAIPWKTDRLTIYIDTASFSGVNTATIEEQVVLALRYFNRGRGTVPTNLTVTQVETRHRADIIVVGNTLPGHVASEGSVYGRSTDTDPALEYYTNATITVDLPPTHEHIGYHIGYWLDRFVNPDEQSTPFKTTDPGSRDDWWREKDR